MTSKAGRKVTTAADMAAAIKVGAIEPTTAVVTVEQAEAMAAEAARAAVKAAPVATAAVAPDGTIGRLDADHHACGIVGCRHGEAHGAGYVAQPDRQVKLAAPCGAVIRATARAINAAGGPGAIKCGHGDPFAEVARRTYNRKATVAA